MLIGCSQQRLLTYMPLRDEYEREYLNEAENRLPSLTCDEEDNQRDNHESRLICDAKLALVRSYAHLLRQRLKLKEFIRDYALAFQLNESSPFKPNLHQISRFLSADQYERLIFNHRRIVQLLEELGCSTNENGHDEESQSTRALKTSSPGRRRYPSLTSNDSSDSSVESFVYLKRSPRRSVRRVSSSSTCTSSRPVVKEPLYTRRRVTQSDTHTVSQRMTRSTLPHPPSSDISWDYSSDEMTTLSDFSSEIEEVEIQEEDENSSSVASRTRSHTPPDLNKQKKRKYSTGSSPQAKKALLQNGSSSKFNSFDPSDQSTPKGSIRMLTRHQLNKS